MLRTLVFAALLLVSFAAGSARADYFGRWDRVGGGWTTGWVKLGGNADVCTHGSQCDCGGQNHCGNYRDGAVTTYWPNGCARPSWQIRCSIRQVAAPASPQPGSPSTAVPYGGNCRGAGCAHPNLTAYGGNGPFGSGAPIVHIHKPHNPAQFYWMGALPPYTPVADYERRCASMTPIPGHLVLLDDEPWYYYFVGKYAQFGCQR